MHTKRQQELINAYLSQFGEDITLPYRDIIMYLAELGYNPSKEGSSISFKCDLHNKQMAKMGIKKSKKDGYPPFFALRFSACRGYSQKYSDIIGGYIAKYPSRTAMCIDGQCRHCAGAADTHVYTNHLPDGTVQHHCGAFAVEIPAVTAEDIGEIKELIRQEHEYLMKYQVG